jgi:predicted DNA-binding transcriptional regulator AlpA
MKAAPRYAGNKAEAAKLAGMSRTTLYQLMRLGNFPKPRADGRWCIAEIRKFALREARKLQGPQKRDELQMELLNLKIRRASQELAEFEQGIRDEITREFATAFKSCMGVLATALRKMPNELSGQFAGMEPIGIFRLWKTRLDDVLNQCAEKLSQAGLDDDESNAVIPFRRERVNEPVALNGASRA